MPKKECTLASELLVSLNHSWTPFEIFNTLTNNTGMTELLEISVAETNRHAIQRHLNFETTKNEIMAFMGIYFTMVVNRLPGVEDYCSTDKSTENEKIRFLVQISND